MAYYEQWRNLMLRYFPIFIGVFFLALFGCVFASQAVVFGMLRDLPTADTAAPAYFSNMLIAALLVLSNLLVVKGIPAGLASLRALMWGALVILGASAFYHAPAGLIAPGAAAAVSALALMSTKRYAEMVKHFLYIRENFGRRRRGSNSPPKR